MKIFETNFSPDFRQDDIKRILDYVMVGKFCQLVCIPGAGKATILRLLAHNRNVLKFHLGENEKSLRFIYSNLFELPNYREGQIAKFLLLALEGKTPKTDDSLVLAKHLNEAINKLAVQGKHIVLLFDHFDEYQNQLPRSFFQMLKSARSVAKYKFATIFATRRDLVDLVDREIAKDYWDFFVGNTVYLKIYDERAVQSIFNQTEKTFSKKLSEKQKGQIVVLTGGHAKLTKILSELVFAEEIDPENNLFLKNAQIRSCLLEIWLFLTAEQQRALYLISQRELKIESNVLENLIKLNLVKDTDKPPQLTFTIPLFFEFVKQMAPDIAEPKIVFDQYTKEIVKGDSIISELLSAQEYRLVKFFVENAGRVVERDELIEAVWPQTQVLEAISDEAIDQMIFRVRKKIEKEPNTPKHLITVKGRGIRFTP